MFVLHSGFLLSFLKNLNIGFFSHIKTFLRCYFLFALVWSIRSIEVNGEIKKESIILAKIESISSKYPVFINM